MPARSCWLLKVVCFRLGSVITATAVKASLAPVLETVMLRVELLGMLERKNGLAMVPPGAGADAGKGIPAGLQLSGASRRPREREFRVSPPARLPVDPPENEKATRMGGHFSTRRRRRSRAYWKYPLTSTSKCTC